MKDSLQYSQRIQKQYDTQKVWVVEIQYWDESSDSWKFLGHDGEVVVRTKTKLPGFQYTWYTQIEYIMIKPPVNGHIGKVLAYEGVGRDHMIIIDSWRLQYRIPIKDKDIVCIQKKSSESYDSWNCWLWNCRKSDGTYFHEKEN